ncbi:MAG: beta-lactamase family protein [Gemmatimonadetes bacterium]|nr:beta-lactamase family protein [Gemmatimonadota bacterium]
MFRLAVAASLVPAALLAQLRGEALRTRIDSLVNAPIKAGQVVGASVAVVKGRDTILVKGYGKANVELDVATPVAGTAIYEIGSITKQFTGAAIMQLVEQGKVSLDDDVTKYLPTFKTGGRKVTLRRLLDHSSGMRSYTEIAAARSFFPLQLPRDTMLRVVESQPWDFEPGEEQIYNNSAFYLVGLVIEKVSGMPYGEYVKKNLFDRAGMPDAHYCSETAIKRGKTSGYDFDASGPIQKRPLSHQWPYAAGSLCMTVRDLVAWNEALHRTNKILSAASYKEMIRPDTLNDGYRVGYAKGLSLTPVLGHPSLHHGGGINGWTTENMYFPAESLSVIVFYNTSGPSGPSEVAEGIVRAMLGVREPTAVPVTGDIARFRGTFAGRGRGVPQQLSIEPRNGTLEAVRGAQRRPLVHVGNGTFLLGSTKFVFAEQGGRVVSLRVDNGSGNNILRPRP